MADLILKSPLAGWAGPLDEMEDEVFASRMLGDGIAIDPTEDVLHAPCDGEIGAIPETAHAVTIRASNGAEILLHVGVDTVALKGEGFEALVRTGDRVSVGDALIRFDLDRIARGARSLVTPVIVTEPGKFRIADRRAPGPVHAGDVLMTVRASQGALPAGDTATAGDETRATLTIALPHGLHARPAAILAQGLKNLRAEVSLSLRGKAANARSAVALLTLGARRGDVLDLRASGADAALVVGALEQALARASAHSGAGPAASHRDSNAGGNPPSRPAIAAEGLALGPAVRIVRGEPVVPEQGQGAPAEMELFDDARKRLATRLLRLAPAEGAAAGIVGAHLEFLEDPELLATAYRHIAQGKSAGFAWRAAINEAVLVLGSLDDRHLAARVDDLRDLELQLLETVAGAAEPSPVTLPAGAIIVARDLLPSQFLALDAARIGGICTVSRAATSHKSSPARTASRCSPGSTRNCSSCPTARASGRRRAGRGYCAGCAEVAAAESRIAARSRSRARLWTARARLPHGRRRAHRGLRECRLDRRGRGGGRLGAEGGLRTGSFFDKPGPPEASEQLAQYQAVVNAFSGRPVVVRTLDAGSDKPIPFLAMSAQDNPALGLRGIRASLWRPELLRAQITAILSVRPANRCRILLPMVNEPSEIEAVRAMIREIAAGLHANADIPVGIMIETPAAALAAARLAAHADFFSIGTNDLTQYVFAIDRTHPLLADGLDAMHPVVLHLIERVASAARGAGRGVAVCGGLASESSAARSSSGWVSANSRQFPAQSRRSRTPCGGARSPNAANSRRAHSRSRARRRSARCSPKATRGNNHEKLVRGPAAVRARADAADRGAADRGAVAAARPAGPARPAGRRCRRPVDLFEPRHPVCDRNRGRHRAGESRRRGTCGRRLLLCRNAGRGNAGGCRGRLDGKALGPGRPSVGIYRRRSLQPVQRAHATELPRLLRRPALRADRCRRCRARARLRLRLGLAGARARRGYVEPRRAWFRRDRPLRLWRAEPHPDHHWLAPCPEQPRLVHRGRVRRRDGRPQPLLRRHPAQGPSVGSSRYGVFGLPHLRRCTTRHPPAGAAPWAD
jgi:phosphocarrier protein FPr/phosphocarrier protein